jgi:hypothetical protein
MKNLKIYQIIGLMIMALSVAGSGIACKPGFNESDSSSKCLPLCEVGQSVEEDYCVDGE